MFKSIAQLSLAAVLAAPLAVAGAIAHAQPKADAGVQFHATLSGANEVGANGQSGVGDPNGTGSFTARLVPGQGQLCYTLTYADIDAPTMGHIHTGAAGVNGGVFVGLTDLSAGQHCITFDKAKATALVAKPGDYYVNLHNTAFPAGAIRGQLMKH